MASNKINFVTDEVLEFIEEKGYSGADDVAFSHTAPIYDYLTEHHNLHGDDVLEFLIDKLNTVLNSK